MTADEVEHRKSAIVAGDGLAIDDAGSNRQRHDSFNGEREAVGEIMAVTGDRPNAAAAPMRQDAEAVVFDLMNPARFRRRLSSRTRQARIEGGNGLLGTQAAPKLTRN